MRGITIKEAYNDECHIGTVLLNERSSEQIKEAIIAAIESHFDCDSVNVDEASYKDAIFMLTKFERGFIECEVNNDDDFTEETIEIETTFFW